MFRSITQHDDVMTWNSFPFYWPFVSGITHRRQIMWIIDDLFVLSLKKLLNKSLNRQWFDRTLMWRPCNARLVDHDPRRHMAPLKLNHYDRRHICRIILYPVVQPNVNSLRVNFSAETFTCIYNSILPPHWHAKGSWNHSFFKTGTHLVGIVNIIAADDLATQGARHQQPWYWPS